MSGLGWARELRPILLALVQLSRLYTSCLHPNIITVFEEPLGRGDLGDGVVSPFNNLGGRNVLVSENCRVEKILVTTVGSITFLVTAS